MSKFLWAFLSGIFLVSTSCSSHKNIGASQTSATPSPTSQSAQRLRVPEYQRFKDQKVNGRMMTSSQLLELQARLSQKWRGPLSLVNFSGDGSILDQIDKVAEVEFLFARDGILVELKSEIPLNPPIGPYVMDFPALQVNENLFEFPTILGFRKAATLEFHEGWVELITHGNTTELYGRFDSTDALN